MLRYGPLLVLALLGIVIVLRVTGVISQDAMTTASLGLATLALLLGIVRSRNRRKR